MDPFIILSIVVVVLSVVTHEISHGVAALTFGDTTARDAGRLSPNPLRHVDPLGSVIVPVALYLLYHFHWLSTPFLFGWAKPVPVNFRLLRPARLGMACVAAAGPVSNLVLACLCVLALQAPGIPGKIAWVMGLLINVNLAVFNILPIPPLDGSRIVAAVLPPTILRYYAALEPFGFVIIVIMLQTGLLDGLSSVVRAIISLMGVQL